VRRGAQQGSSVFQLSPTHGGKTTVRIGRKLTVKQFDYRGLRADGGGKGGGVIRCAHESPQLTVFSVGDSPAEPERNRPKNSGNATQRRGEGGVFLAGKSEKHHPAQTRDISPPTMSGCTFYVRIPGAKRSDLTA